MPRHAGDAGDPHLALPRLRINRDLLPLFDHTTLPADPADLDAELRERLAVLIDLAPCRSEWPKVAPRLDPFIRATIGVVGVGWTKKSGGSRAKYTEAFVKLCKRNLRDRQQLWYTMAGKSWQQVCQDHDYPPSIDHAQVDEPSSAADIAITGDRVEEESEDEVPAAMYLGAFKLPPFKLPTSIANAQELIVDRVKLVLDWNGAYASSAAERSSAMTDVREMIGYMFEKADPTLEQARALYAAPYTSDPVAVVHALPFYHPEWDDLGAIGYIKSVSVTKDDLAKLAASSNRRTSERVAAVKEGLLKSPSKVIRNVLDAANISIDDLETTLSHGGLTQAGMVARIERDMKVARRALDLKLSFWHASIGVAAAAAESASAERRGTRQALIAYVALVDPYCGGSPPAEDRVRLISLGEHVAASFSVGCTNTNIAKLGMRESTPLPRADSILSAVALADFRTLRTSLSADTPFTLAFLHQQPGVGAKPDDLLTIPVVLFLNRILEYTLDRPVRSFRSARAAAAAHADSTGLSVIHFDANSINKVRGKNYEKMVDPNGVVRNFEQHVLDGRENPSSPIVLVVCTGVADAGLQLLSASTTTSTFSEFRTSLNERGLVFSPNSPEHDPHDEQTVAISSLLKLAASFTHLAGSSTLTAACIAGVAGSIDVGLAVARRLGALKLEGMPVDERLKIVNEIVQAAKSKDGGLLPYSQARLDTLRLAVHSRNFDVTVETVERGLSREGLSVASNDLETLVQLLALGYDGTTRLEDHLSSTRAHAASASSRVALTSLDQSFKLMITKKELSRDKQAAMAGIVFVSIGQDRSVRARSLGAVGNRGATLMYSDFSIHQQARSWIRKNLGAVNKDLVAAKFRLTYSAARRDFRMVLLGSCDGSTLAPPEVRYLGFLDSISATVRLLMPEHREMDFMFRPMVRNSRAEHLALMHAATRIIATDMLDGINTTQLAIKVTLEMQQVDRRWTYQRVEGWVRWSIVGPGHFKLQLEALQLPAPQHRLDELAALKKQAEQLKADLARRKAQLAQLHQLREARGNLDPAVKELRDAIALWKPHEREASLPQEEEEERIDELWALCVITAAKTTASAFTQFIPTVMRDFRFSKTNTLLITAPPYIVAAIFSLILSRVSDRKGQRCYFYVVPLVVGMIGFIIAAATLNTAARYVAIVLALCGLHGNFNILLAWYSGIFQRPRAKRAVAIGFINSFGNLAQIWSPYLYPKSDGPEYSIAVITNSVVTALAIALSLVLRFFLARDNARMDREEAEFCGDNEKDVGSDGLSRIAPEQKQLRYVL
ncbi:hypothetical protein JCM8208_004326 [Rhodotorula glutinis]